MSKYSRCSGMAALRIAMVLSAWFLFTVVPSALSAQSQSSTQSNLAAKEKRFIAYHSDFIDFAKAVQNSEEFEYVYGFSDLAHETVEQVDAVIALLKIYNALSCNEDRAKISPIIREEVVTYSKYIELSIQSANLSLSAIKRPGVVAEGIRMRDDLRELKDILRSINLQ